MSLRLVLVLGALVLASCTTTAPPVETGPVTPSATSPSTGPDTSETPSSPPTSPTSSTEPADPLTRQVQELMQVTSEIRGLPFVEMPDVTFLSEAEVAERLRELFEEDLDVVQYAATDELLTVLGLLPEDEDLLQLVTEIQTEQVVAFYDTDSGELVSPITEEELSATEKLTMVHELTHALTDQHFDLFTVMDRLDSEQRYDTAAAFRALTEGDATVVEIVYLQGLPRAEQLAILEEVISFESPIFEASPRFLQDSLLFPYLQGREFVTSIWTADGFAGVDDAYLDYPTTTENIYQIETYVEREEALPTSLPELHFDGYDLIERSTWGYLGFQTVFDQVLSGTVANEASRGWGGDSYQLHWNGRDMVLVLRYAGDREQDAVELRDALAEFVEASMKVEDPSSDGGGTAYTGEDYAFLSSHGDQVVFIAAGDPAIGRLARASFPDF